MTLRSLYSDCFPPVFRHKIVPECMGSCINKLSITMAQRQRLWVRFSRRPLMWKESVEALPKVVGFLLGPPVSSHTNWFSLLCSSCHPFVFKFVCHILYMFHSNCQSEVNKQMKFTGWVRINTVKKIITIDNSPYRLIFYLDKSRQKNKFLERTF
jgi:hypothetical protein